MNFLKEYSMNQKQIDLSQYGLQVKDVLRNAPAAKLYEEILSHEPDAQLVSSGAISVSSHEKTGRSPKDKRVVQSPESEADIWWGKINMPIKPETFDLNRKSAIDYLNTCSKLYIMDGFAGWDEDHRIKVRVIVSRPYHALFMNNMLIRPSREELLEYGEPDYLILNAGAFPAKHQTDSIVGSTSVCLSFEKKELVILGTEYAGEMKKGVFTIMNYIMPKKGVLSMHASANEGKEGDVAIFFGLSGTGKTTLSADSRRLLVGDDEHCWTEKGIFNIEGGCYAKCIGLTEESEPEIYRSVRFGTILENVGVNPTTYEVDYNDISKTENTRASYPIEYIENAKITGQTNHPNHILFLTCDAFGVLPPVSKLTPEQALYHFMSGYTAKVAGTEMGVTEPEATFSACFGAAFMPMHPAKYAQLLLEKILKHKTKVWLINTGWIGGAYGVGARISLKYTRSIVDNILGKNMELKYSKEPIFNLSIPKEFPGVPKEILIPRNTWKTSHDYDAMIKKLAQLFQNNFQQFLGDSFKETFGEEKAAAIISAGPVIS